MARYHQSQLAQRDFAARHGIGLSPLVLMLSQSRSTRPATRSKTICLGAQLRLQKVVELEVTEWRRVKITPAISRDPDSPKTGSKAKPGVRLAAGALCGADSGGVPDAGPKTR